jgi:large subunit ribosomal protein L21
MKYGIIEANSRQYWIEQGKYIDIDNLIYKVGTKVEINRILFLKRDNEIIIGKPYISNIKIEAVIRKHFLSIKLIVYKMKPKKKYRRKQGHRQHLTRLLIEKISL